MFYVWLGVITLLSLIEVLTINLTTIWFVMSALVSLVLSFFTDSVFIQFLVFVILGVILLAVTKPLLVKKVMPKKTKTNLDRVIGMKGIVTEKITKTKPGEVKVDGKNWTAISDQTIPEGHVVVIEKMEGVKLFVSKENEE